jgi:hypothetical protein
MASEAQETNVPSPQLEGRIQVQVTADVNITAAIARRLVNIELMKKVGQSVMAGEPEIYIDGQQFFWKVPFLVVPPDDDLSTYPTGRYALVDAISGCYVLDKASITELKAATRPILYQLYPDLPEWMQKIREAKSL